MKYQTEIQQCIYAFQKTLDVAKTCRSLDFLNAFAHDIDTEDGICGYIDFHFSMAYELKEYLKISPSKFMFKDKIFGKSSIFLLWMNDDKPNVQYNWREIAIDLCQQRIDYLKKFI